MLLPLYCRVDLSIDDFQPRISGFVDELHVNSDDCCNACEGETALPACMDDGNGGMTTHDEP